MSKIEKEAFLKDELNKKRIEEERLKKEIKKQQLLIEKSYLDQELTLIYSQKNELQNKVSTTQSHINSIWKEASDVYRWNYYNSVSKEFKIIDSYDGKKFENFIAILYVKMGYTLVFQSKGADQGADLIIKKGSSKTAVQIKRWKNKIGNSAVQEVIGAMHYYTCKEGVVVTNSHFTKEAISLAKSANIKLIDRDSLAELCYQFSISKDTTLPFDRSKYDAASKLLTHINGTKDEIEEIIYEVIYEGETLNDLSEQLFIAEQKLELFQSKVDEQLKKIRYKSMAIDLL